MSYFSGKDLVLIESLVYQPDLTPTYDVMRDALTWSDEYPEGLSYEGQEKLVDLWAARSFLHKDMKFSDWKLDPKYFGMVWEEATRQGFSWPGFKRLKLTPKDRLYYENQQKAFLDEHEY